MNQQSELFHEDIFEALRTDVMASGGTKTVGAALRPSMKVTEAQTWLSNCLNRSRAEKLDGEDILFIKKLAKQHNSFATVFYECGEIGLSHPQPIEPEDERARLQREYINSVKTLERLSSQLGKLQS